MPLKEVTEKLVLEYDKQFKENEEYFLAEQILANLFNKFPKNDNLEHVWLKTLSLNHLFNAGILGTFRVAKHIKNKNLEIDKGLREGDPAIVDQVANIEIVQEGKPIRLRRFYSFATKYCSFHNPENYPIYDSFASKTLLAYGRQDQFDNFTRQNLRDYPRFKEIVESFRRSYHLENISFRQIDHFLYLYGRELIP